MESGLCTIRTWEQFKAEFKRAFYPNNVVADARKRLRDLKQTGNVKTYIKEFIALTFRIPDLTDAASLFHFTDGLQSWAKAELERRQVSTLDEAITQAESLSDFRQVKSKTKNARPSPAKGGGDRDKGKEAFLSKGVSCQPAAKERDQPPKNKSCFMCGGAHWYGHCPQLKK